MYNCNMSLSTPPMLGVGVDFGTTTPRTPEILNSLIAMTNPFEYSYASALTSQSSVIPSSNDVSPVIACKTESFLNQQYDNNSQSNCSSSSSLESPSTTPLHLAATISSTPSLQQTRSQLIKAGVKLLIQSKRKNSGSSSCDADYRPPPPKIRATSTALPTSRKIVIPTSEVVSPTITSPKEEPIDPFQIKTDSTTSCDEDSEPKFSASKHELTPEDEDRRKRRRERNKIAATKCRMKKRECINNLMRESETLEAQNVDIKAQLKDLREQYQYLTEMWQAHQMECKNPGLLGNSHEQNNNGNSIDIQFNEQENIKDTNNNKHLQELPSLTPLINCNLSFDFY
ncbi:CLUMA_CG003151, isoform A [Clunio marinus]|uniref:CLUMA_CG003151, isoform A n=1 Tax=Clunio marinus TaxID=568069 RepID=A0A1J1HT81_9DIPT|nr:CLUMA_CG003151, isoform A [Clunio marinus]